MGWGAHRIGQDKSLPYTTPLPLYMSWPGRWGSDPRQITDVTSNIDLAPTFCALAGCTLGSYPAGQQRADGSSLLPLLDGEVASLARKSVLETNWESGKRWTAIRTGFNNRLLGPWHYVEHSTGEKELYDLTADPWELHNQANNSSLSSVQEALRQRLDRLRNEGVRAHVDATINVPAGTIKGAHLTSAVPLRSQTVTLLDVAPGTTREFVIRAWNRGGQPDRLTIQGETMGSSQISVAYRVGGVDVTASLINGTYTTALLDIQRNVELRVRMTVASAAPAGSRAESVVRVSSIAEPVKVDVVKAVAVH
jgi:hypothetical protein